MYLSQEFFSLQVLLMVALWSQCLLTVAHYLKCDQVNFNSIKLKIFERKTVLKSDRLLTCSKFISYRVLTVVALYCQALFKCPHCLTYKH